MRVLLISANTEQIQMPVLPMGLACVAAAVEKAGHEVRVLNLMTRDDCGRITEDAISGFRPEATGISVRNIDDQSMRAPRFLLDSVREIVRSCRNATSSPLILGGAGYSIYPESALAYLRADMGIAGEGEASFVTLLDRLSRNEDLSDLPNLVLPGSRSWRRGSAARRLDDFTLPVPNGPLSFPAEFKNQKVWLPFQTRRGCPMECSYCSTAAIEGRILRKRSPEAVLRSIQQYVEAGFTHFFFVDNTFNFPSSYAKRICDGIVERRLDIRWRAILYPWKVDEELIGKMARAGCVEVSFGFESGSRKILRSMNKRFQPEDIRRISKILDRWEIGRMGFLLLGSPGETRETVLESLEFADSLDLESMKVTAGIRIYPYTALAATAVREGTVAEGDDLLQPRFYLAKGLDGWIGETVSRWLDLKRNWHS